MLFIYLLWDTYSRITCSLHYTQYRKWFIIDQCVCMVLKKSIYLQGVENIHIVMPLSWIINMNAYDIMLQVLATSSCM